jgi:chromosome segregation ATPase
MSNDILKKNTLEEQISVLKQDKQQTQDEISGLLLVKEGVISDIQLLNDKVESLLSDIVNLSIQIESSNGNIKALKLKFISDKKDIVNKTAEYNTKLSSIMSDYRSRLSETQEILTNLNNEVVTLSSDKDILNKQNIQTSAEINLNEIRNNELIEEGKTLDKSVELKKEELDQLEYLYDIKLSEVEKANQMIAELEKEAENKTIEIDKSRTEIKTYVNILNNKEIKKVRQEQLKDKKLMVERDKEIMRKRKK